MPIVCPECKYVCADQMLLDKHTWIHHPKDLFQRHYSALAKSGKLDTKPLSYQDDCYN